MLLKSRGVIETAVINVPSERMSFDGTRNGIVYAIDKKKCVRICIFFFFLCVKSIDKYIYWIYLVL